MVSKLFFISIVGFFSLHTVSAQKKDPKFFIGLESQLLISGELNSSFDFLAGANGYYFFSPKQKITPFINAGLATDLANTNARIILADFQMGAKFNFSPYFSFLMSFGGSYLNESHTHSLIEQDVIWYNTALGITGDLGLSFQVSKSVFSTLFLKQNNFNLTSVGLGVNYSF